MRDAPVKRVFPELHLRCRARQVEFIGVYLRWGITEEQSAQGEVLPVCFAEIERCRPYFVALPGDRYGSSVATISAEKRAVSTQALCMVCEAPYFSFNQKGNC